MRSGAVTDQKFTPRLSGIVTLDDEGNVIVAPLIAFRVEIKLIAGDNYPAVIRGMKAVGARLLLVGEYTGAGATWGDLVKVFGRH